MPGEIELIVVPVLSTYLFWVLYPRNIPRHQSGDQLETRKYRAIYRTYLLVGWGFTSWQHLRSYQYRQQLVTVYTHGEFIVLPN